MTVAINELNFKIDEKIDAFSNEALKHKNLYRSLWALSAVMSLSISVISIFELAVFSIESKKVITFLSLFLPLITAYIVMRTPEKLWVLGISARNKLYDLKVEIEFNRKDVSEYENKYLEILKNSSEKWESLKNKY